MLRRCHFNQRAATSPIFWFAGFLSLVAVQVNATTTWSQTADFEDFPLAPHSTWNGPVPEEEGVEQPGLFGGVERWGFLTSGGIDFVNRFNLTWDSWSGFAVSNGADVTTAGIDNQFSAWPGTGFNVGADNYGVGFGFFDDLDSSDPEQLQQLPFLNVPSGSHLAGAYFTNTTYAGLAVKNGLPPSEFSTPIDPFGGASGTTPDHFRLKIYGTARDGAALDNSVEFFLADYRPEDSSQDYVVDEWTYVDLRDLAGAERIYFALDSTDVGDFGMNTPGYFAIDNIVLRANVLEPEHISEICTAVAAHSTLPWFDVDSDGAISSDDVTALLSQGGRLPADADFDGEVGFSDFLELAGHFGQPTTWSHGDFDCDGVAQIEDFLILADHFGKSSSSITTVPEPDTAGLAGIMSLLLAACRRRCSSRSSTATN